MILLSDIIKKQYQMGDMFGGKEIRIQSRLA